MSSINDTRDVDPVDESELSTGDVVLVAGALEDELGVVVSEPPMARVQLPKSGLTVRAIGGPILEILEQFDELLGVDAEHKYHLLDRTTGSIAVRDVGGEDEQRFPLDDVPGEDLSETLAVWVRHVDEVRGWFEHRAVYDSRGWFR